MSNLRSFFFKVSVVIAGIGYVFITLALAVILAVAALFGAAAWTDSVDREARRQLEESQREVERTVSSE